MIDGEKATKPAYPLESLKKVYPEKYDSPQKKILHAQAFEIGDEVLFKRSDGSEAKGKIVKINDINKTAAIEFMIDGEKATKPAYPLESLKKVYPEKYDSPQKKILNDFLNENNIFMSDDKSFEEFYKKYLEGESDLKTRPVGKDLYYCANIAIPVTGNVTLEFYKTKNNKEFAYSQNFELGKGAQKTVFNGLEMNDGSKVVVSLAKGKDQFPLYKMIASRPLKNVLKILGLCEIKGNSELIVFAERMKCGFHPRGPPICSEGIPNDYQILKILLGAIQGLGEIHKLGWNQGDFHIGNIMYNLEGDHIQVALIDFDLSYDRNDKKFEYLRETIRWDENRISNEVRNLFRALIDEPISLTKERSGVDSPEFLIKELRERDIKKYKESGKPLTIDEWISGLQRIIEKMESLGQKNFKIKGFEF
jgi:hypothetical protein